MAMMEIIPLDEDSKAIVMEIMNGQHPDAIRIYARHFGGKAKATSASLTDLDSKQITLKYTSPGENGSLTMPYVDAAGAAITVRTIGDCRRALVGMARVAAEVLGEHIELPEPRTIAPGTPGGPSNGPEVMALLEQMRQMMEAKGQGKGSASGDVAPGGIRTLHGGAASQSSVFKGQGNKLGSSTPVPESAPGSSAQLREVDPEKPTVSLRVQLLDRKQAQVVVNHDFTISELRAWLDHHQGSTSQYHLMEVSGFPPKKLSDYTMTVEGAGLTKKGCSLACKPS